MKWWLLGIGTAVLIGVGWFVHDLIVALRFFQGSDSPRPRRNRQLEKQMRKIYRRPR